MTSPVPSGGIAAPVAIALWLLTALLLAWTPITDQDLGWHIALGRVLQQDFGAVRTLLLGQDASVTAYAYSYWLYQMTVAALFDHLGPGSIVALRILLVLGAIAIALATASRLGASRTSRGLFLALAVLTSFERFVDRPDVFSHLAWIGALWILLFHRSDRGRWALLGLQVLWTNTHHHYMLLPAAAAAFWLGDRIDRREDARRGLILVASLLAATLVNPAGPAIWRSQLKLAGVLTGEVAPIPLLELLGSYAGGHSFFSLWVFRVTLPLGLAAAVLARRRLGTGALLVLLAPALLGVLARRAISLYALTALALLPAAMDELLRRLPVRGRRVLPAVVSGGLILTGALAIGGLANGRLLFAQGKEFGVGSVGRPLYPAAGAARFVREERVEGPLYHNPTFAGAILLENGARLAPFLDPRWCGRADHNETYVRLVAANDETVGADWAVARERFGFEAVMLDFYEMPALLRHLASDPGWGLAFVDEGAALYLRRGGPNAPILERREAEISARRAVPDPERDRRLAEAVTRFLESRPPSPLAPVRFPWGSFHRANFAMQTFDRPGAAAAYLELLETERGALHASRHRSDLLGNILWCLAESAEFETVARLAGALAREEGATVGQRRGWELTRARALLGLRRFDEAEPIARSLAEDGQASAEERWTAWLTVAGAREGKADHLGAIEALREAADLRPTAPETYFYLGAILDGELHREAEALEAYRKFRGLGGADSRVEVRIGQLTGTPTP